jgi:hypothetical protein
MKRTVLTFGLISGVLSSVMMVATIPFIDQIGFDRGMVIGYTMIVLSFLLVFFGVRSYRDNVAGGTLSFGRGFLVGILITLISCLFYVATWEVLYFGFMPDFLDKWAAYAMDTARAEGASEAELQRRAAEMASLKAWYSNPLINVAMTFMEPFPVGLLVTAISAAVLRRKPAAAGVSV